MDERVVVVECVKERNNRRLRSAWREIAVPLRPFRVWCSEGGIRQGMAAWPRDRHRTHRPISYGTAPSA
jgi:hypothetical protein